MVNDKVEPWINKMGDAVIAYVSERYDHAYDIYPLTLKELLARHAAPEIAGKDIKIGVQTKVIVARNQQIASLQEETARLKDYSARWPGNMEDDYQAMQEENERLTEENAKLLGGISDIRYGIFTPETDVEKAVQKRCDMLLEAKTDE